MKQETETGRGFKNNGTFVAIVVSVSFITALVCSLVLGRVLTSQLDALQQETETIRTQITLLDYKFMKAQADLLVLMRSDVTQSRFDCSVQEVARIKEIYNSLASRYNSSMAKSDWRFTSAESLPQGVSSPLPREFKLYRDL